MDAKPLKKSIALTFRCPMSVVQQLDEICKVYGIRRSQFLISAITSEYDKIQGNPQLLALMDQLRQMTDTLQGMTAQPELPTLAEQVAQYDSEQMSYRDMVLSGLTSDELCIVDAMETAGFVYHPTVTYPIYFEDDAGYPITFVTWQSAYEWINGAELRDTPGLREQVQAVLHPIAEQETADGDGAQA